MVESASQVTPNSSQIENGTPETPKQNKAATKLNFFKKFLNEKFLEKNDGKQFTSDPRSFSTCN